MRNFQLFLIFFFIILLNGKLKKRKYFLINKNRAFFFLYLKKANNNLPMLKENKRSFSTDKKHSTIKQLKLTPISSLFSFHPLNNSFYTQKTQRNNKKQNDSPYFHHKRVFSSSSQTSKRPELIISTTFKDKSTVANSMNFYSGSGQSSKSRPISSLFGSFHADKTQKDFLKNQKDPIFKDFNTLIKKSRANTPNPFDEILGNFHENGGKKQREIIFYLRKMNHAKILMADLVKEFKKYDGSIQIEEKEIYLNHIKENWSESVNIFKNIAEILQNLIIHAGDRDVISKNLSFLIQESQKLKIYQLNLLCIMFYAKCCLITKDYFRAISLFKQAKFIARSYSNMKLRLKCYKGLGICCQILKKYSLAKHYFIRVLQLAWLVGDKQNELLAYDSIGLQYYYLGDVDQARNFHFKMMKGEYEDESSSIRALGISKLGISKEKNPKNKFKIKKETTNIEMPENPILCFSSSDEEFELMIPQDFIRKVNKNDNGEYSMGNIFRINPIQSNFTKNQIMKKANENIRYKSILEYEASKIQKINILKTQKHMVSSKFLQNNPNINSKVMLSHLTPNKSVNFFHNTMFKFEEISNEENANQIFNKLDGRSMKKIIKKAKYFSANILFTIKNVQTILKCVGLNKSLQV